MKKIIAIVLTLLMILAVTGCAGSSETTTSVTESPKAAEAAKPAEPATPVESAESSTPAETYEWTLSCGNAEGTTQAMAAHYLADLLKERSNGAIDITVYAGGTLGSAVECIGGVQMGSIDMIVESSGNFANYTDAMKVFDLPYLFDSNETARAVLSTDAARAQLDAMTSVGLKGLSYFEVGMYAVGSSKPIESLADFANIRVRTMDSEVHASTYSALGAMPVVIAWGDIYTSLQQGVIDAVSSTAVPNMFSMNFYEVAPYITNTNHCYCPSICVMNNDLWESLSAETQELILTCAEEARQYDYQICDEALESNIAEMEAAGTTFYDIDVSEWAAKVQSVYDQFVSENGINPDVFASIKSEADKTMG